jgi:hypothetical protein
VIETGDRKVLAVAEGYIDRLAATIRDTHAAVAKYDATMKFIGGCTDGDCLVTGKATGMHTNARCRCYDDTMKAQLVMRAARQLRDTLDAL